jgi:hypothetical protein
LHSWSYWLRVWLSSVRPDHVAAIAVMLAVLAVAALAGFLIGRHVYKPATVAVLETPAHPIEHGDGSSTMARVVDRKPVTPAPTTPKGKVIATTEVTVKPDGPCEPVTVRVDLTESVDGGLRASERVTGGETIEAVHYAPPVRYVQTERKYGLGIEHRDGETSALVERYWPGARAGLTISDKSVGVSAVWRFN